MRSVIYSLDILDGYFNVALIIKGINGITNGRLHGCYRFYYCPVPNSHTLNFILYENAYYLIVQSTEIDWF
jgi:hypothetical protein